MEMRALTTGRVRSKRSERGIRRYLPGGWSEETLPVHAFVIEHPDGVCLFDGGQTARAAGPGYFPWWHPFLRLARFELGRQDEVAAQLDPDVVRWVALSHLHTDHVGGIAAFVSAEVLVSRGEWKRASGLGGRLRGYLPQHWPAGLVPTLIDLEGPPFGPFEATHDIAGDGRLLLVALPGHTPWHLGMVVRDGPSTYLLAADLVHSAAELEAAAPELAAWCRAERVTVLAAHDELAPSLLEQVALPA
jgi:glyoxylase-like metal-dependent hydrolase (beta-lactamase superfamily II)